jgi:hypothetical protein
MRMVTLLRGQAFAGVNQRLSHDAILESCYGFLTGSSAAVVREEFICRISD